MFIFLLSYLGQRLFFVVKIPHFAKNKMSQATQSRENFGKFPKELPHFKDVFRKIANMFLRIRAHSKLSSF